MPMFMNILFTVWLSILAFCLSVAVYNLFADPGGRHDYQPINDFCTTIMLYCMMGHILVLPILIPAIGIWAIWFR